MLEVQSNNARNTLKKYTKNLRILEEKTIDKTILHDIFNSNLK